MTQYRFHTTDSELAHLNGRLCRVVRAIRHPDATHDAEVLPMFVCEFEDCSNACEAWRDELTRLDSYFCPICGQRIDDGKPCGCGARV